MIVIPVVLELGQVLSLPNRAGRHWRSRPHQECCSSTTRRLVDDIQVNDAEIVLEFEIHEENHQKIIRNHQKSRRNIIRKSHQTSTSHPSLSLVLVDFSHQPFGEIRSSPVRFLRFPDLDLDALEVGGDLQWQEPSDDSHSAAERGLDGLMLRGS